MDFLDDLINIADTIQATDCMVPTTITLTTKDRLLIETKIDNVDLTLTVERFGSEYKSFIFQIQFMDTNRVDYGSKSTALFCKTSEGKIDTDHIYKVTKNFFNKYGTEYAQYTGVVISTVIVEDILQILHDIFDHFNATHILPINSKQLI